MGILIIGNGFDIAHGMKTEYGSFLQFLVHLQNSGIINAFNGVVTDEIIVDENIKKIVDLRSGNTRNNVFSEQNFWNKYAGDNVWIQYFLETRNLSGRWVDFEDEIRIVLREAQEVIKCLREKNYDNIWDYEKFLVIKEKAARYVVDEKDDEKYLFNVIELLEDHLGNVEIAFERYLSNYIIPLIADDYLLSEIDDLLSCGEVTKCISFNYTPTLSIKYGFPEDNIIYVHGKISNESGDLNSKIVIGADMEKLDYTGDVAKKLIPFQKFYRREYKGCSHGVKEISEYYKSNESEMNELSSKLEEEISVNRIQDDVYDAFSIVKEHKKKMAEYISECKERIYIFGHSLALSDKEYLNDLLLYKYAYVVVFYHNDESKARLMQNLISMIGRDNFSKRTALGQIVFRKQKE